MSDGSGSTEIIISRSIEVRDDEFHSLSRSQLNEDLDDCESNLKYFRELH
jgi:hypothetical protein